MKAIFWIHRALLTLSLGGLSACSSSAPPQQTPMSEGMAARIMSRDMNKRSSFENAMVTKNSGMGSYMEKQGYKSKTYTRTNDFHTPKDLKQKDFARAGQSNPMGSQNYAQPAKEGSFSNKGFATQTAREGAQVATQQGQSYRTNKENFRTRSVSDAARSQAENIRPLIVKPDGPVSDGPSYSEEDIRRLVNRN